LALPYIKPGVSVSEIVSPQLTPILLDPNVIAIVAPGRGYEEHVETIVLVDNTPVALGANNADPDSIVVRDARDITLAPFTPSRYNAAPPDVDVLEDYDVDTTSLLTTGEVYIRRSMQTAIDNGETVTLYYETSLTPGQSDAETVHPTLTMLQEYTPTQGAVAGLVDASIFVTSQGRLVNNTDYNLDDDDDPTTIVWINTSARVKKFQTVYLDFEIGGNLFKDQPLQLDELTPVNLPAGIDGSTLVVKTAPGTFTSNATAYGRSSLEEDDYTVSGSGASTRIRRSQGSTTIGGLNDQLTVRVSYRATPSDYYLPTRCFSQNDVETKFGPAFDSSGAILNPLSLAALFAFQNGATQLVCQALFSGSLSAPAPPTGALANWELAFQQLRTVQDISLLVPIIAAGDLATTVTDALNLQILQAAQNHVRYMAAQENQFMMVLAGEDGTGSTLATPTVLQAHAEGLGQGYSSEAVVLLSPSSYTFANPVTGTNQDIGGQYVAAAVAGMAARYPVQMPLTRKRINGLTSLKTVRTETQKDQDAQAGLCVVENKRGRIQVRHSITTNKDTRAQQEFSVVRAKYWMMKTLVEALDTQAIGQLVLDAEANFLIQVLISAELDLLIQQGAIVEYGEVQVRPDPSDPTALQVRFTYLPAYPLNHINISFSVSASQGVSFEQSTATQGF
jgi:hypothetical protein